MERDREVLEEEELLEREYLQDDGEEDEELEKQVVMIISFQHVFSFHSYCLLCKYLKLISCICFGTEHSHVHLKLIRLFAGVVALLADKRFFICV